VSIIKNVYNFVQTGQVHAMELFYELTNKLGISKYRNY